MEDFLDAIFTGLSSPDFCLLKKRLSRTSPLVVDIFHVRSTFVLFTPSTTIVGLSGLLLKVNASKNNTKNQKKLYQDFPFNRRMIPSPPPSSSKAILFKISANLSSKAYQIAVVMRQQSKHSPISSKEYSLVSSLKSWMNMGTSFSVLIQRIFSYKECSFIYLLNDIIDRRQMRVLTGVQTFPTEIRMLP